MACDYLSLAFHGMKSDISPKSIKNNTLLSIMKLLCFDSNHTLSNYLRTNSTRVPGVHLSTECAVDWLNFICLCLELSVSDWK